MLKETITVNSQSYPVVRYYGENNEIVIYLDQDGIQRRLEVEPTKKVEKPTEEVEKPKRKRRTKAELLEDAEKG